MQQLRHLLLLYCFHPLRLEEVGGSGIQGEAVGGRAPDERGVGDGEEGLETPSTID